MPARRTALAAVAVVATALLAGCGSTVTGRAEPAGVPAGDLALIRAYVADLNAAGTAGPRAQAAFLRATQEPDTPPPGLGCLGSVTLRSDIVERTLRPDTDFVAPRRGGPPQRPAGAVYVVAASVSADLDGSQVREQIGSKHLVVRDGHVFDYAPCPD